LRKSAERWVLAKVELVVIDMPSIFTSFFMNAVGRRVVVISIRGLSPRRRPSMALSKTSSAYRIFASSST
jgi:hypothetical protein